VKKVILIIGVVVIIAVIAFFNIRFKKKSSVSVEVETVKRKTISKIVKASGRIQPKRRVNVSASAIGKVTKVAVKEGDYVERGDFLLQIDPTEYRSVVEQLEAGIRASEATRQVERASLEKAEYDYERAKRLYDKGFLSEEELKDAAITVKIQASRVKSAHESLLQKRATLETALHDLSEVRITAEMSGIITALNVEEGENAIMGTLNNPGTVLLTISDLSEMEAEVEVDETEIIHVKRSQSSTVELDAYPDTTFNGVVAEVGNSAIQSQIGLGQESVDFEVVISIMDSIPGIRPGLSASADIKVAEVESALAIPIQCLTVRKSSELSGGSDSVSVGAGDEEEIEGVFVIENNTAVFKRVTVGIAGEEYFEVRSGLEEGVQVVSGPFKVINEIRDGDLVKIKKALDQDE